MGFLVLSTAVDKVVDKARGGAEPMDRVGRAQEALRAKVGLGDYDAWLRPLRMSADENGRILIDAPNRFYRDWVGRKYLGVLRECFSATDEPEPEILLRIDENPQRELFQQARATEAPAVRTSMPARPGNLIPRYIFESFVVGPSNQFAHAAARAVADRPGGLYNPLFLYGSVGVGKTHLANAIGHAVLARNPLAKVAYLSSESFVNDLISSIRRDRMDNFKLRFRNVDVLILDDVQFLAGRERTQEEFFHTFNSLYEAHKQIILTSDKFPKEISDLEERLRNRFQWGLTADIQLPDSETRVAIVQKKAEAIGLPLVPDLATVVARSVGPNVREIEGAITRVAAYCSLHHRNLDRETIEEVLLPLRGFSARTPSVDEIQKRVAAHYGLTITELVSKKRTQQIAHARQVAMYLVRKLVGASYPAIGRAFGGRDHSTVIHACNAIEKRRSGDPDLSSLLDEIERGFPQQR